MDIYLGDLIYFRDKNGKVLKGVVEDFIRSDVYEVISGGFMYIVKKHEMMRDNPDDAYARAMKIL